MSTLIRASPARADRRWAVLAVILAAAVLDLLDATITNVAAPTIAADLGGGAALIQWLGAAYALALGVLLVVGGRLGDRYGRRRLFLLGITGFTLASVACGLAVDPGTLIGARLVQGGFGALMIPQGFGILGAVFPRDQLGKAFSVFAPGLGVSSVGGPVLAGFLIEADLGGLGWRAMFLINIVLGGAALLAAIRLLPADGPRSADASRSAGAARSADVASSAGASRLADGPRSADATRSAGGPLPADGSRPAEVSRPTGAADFADSSRSSEAACSPRTPSSGVVSIAGRVSDGRDRSEGHSADRLQSRPEGRSGAVAVDGVGAGVLAVAMVGLLHGLIDGSAHGWTLVPILCLAGGLVFFGLFCLRQRTAASPLIEPSLLRNRGFTAGLVLGVVFFAAVSGLLYVLVLYMQYGLRFTPVRAALGLAPVAVGIVIASIACHRLIARLGRTLIVIGLVIGLIGTGWLLAVVRGVADGVWPLVLAALVIGLGMGTCFGTVYDVTVGDIDPHEAGSASGALAATQQLANAIGAAAVTTVYFRTGDQAQAATGSLLVVVAATIACCGLVWLLPRKAQPHHG
ncbi:MFS transporter [Nonomuraea sp. NPDC049269]|uniref:MFS transporter n=1 Tax=Nonomuraea sp. NPDC049269 TaxID=3364349 RepID=UPI00372369CB